MAFLLPGGGASLLMLNRGAEAKTVKPVWRDQVTELELPAQSLTSVIFPA